MRSFLAIQRAVIYSHRKQGTFLDEEHVFHQVVAGRWEFRMAGRLYVVGPGDLVLLPPYLLHTVTPLPGGRVVLNVCHFILRDRMPELERAPMVIALPRRARATVAGTFGRLHAEWLGSAPRRDLMLAALLLQILGLYLRNGDAEAPFAAIPYRAWRNIHAAVAFLQANHHRSDLGITEIAAAAEQSPAHFSRLFKAHLGMSPYRYLCRYRIERAKELLMHGRLGCAAVALATGHGDAATFSRSFHRLEGLSPTRWMDGTVFPGA